MPKKQEKKKPSNLALGGLRGAANSSTRQRRMDAYLEDATGESSKPKPKPKAKAKGGEPTTFSEIARTDSEAQAPKGADDLV